MPKISSGGRVTIPLQIRAALRLHAGDHVEFVAMEEEFVMVAAPPRRELKRSAFKHESFADIPPRRGSLSGPRKARLVIPKSAISASHSR
jgi:AbrB family looped-hinge helix DNA binding protein